MQRVFNLKVDLMNLAPYICFFLLCLLLSESSGECFKHLINYFAKGLEADHKSPSSVAPNYCNYC